MAAPNPRHDKDRSRSKRGSLRDRERAALDLDRIVEAAIAIADEQGPDAVTMRAVAARLEVGVMSLYWYVPTKNDLEGQIVLRLMDEATSHSALTGDCRADLADLARSCRRALLRHTWLVDWIGRVGFAEQSEIGQQKLQHMEHMLKITESLPVDIATRFRITMMVDDFALAFTLWEIVKRRQLEAMELTAEELHQGIVSAGGAPLSQGEYPAFSELVLGGFEPPDADKQFEDALQTLLDGIEAQLARSPRVVDDSSG